MTILRRYFFSLAEHDPLRCCRFRAKRDHWRKACQRSQEQMGSHQRGERATLRVQLPSKFPYSVSSITFPLARPTACSLLVRSLTRALVCNDAELTYKTWSKRLLKFTTKLSGQSNCWPSRNLQRTSNLNLLDLCPRASDRSSTPEFIPLRSRNEPSTWERTNSLFFFHSKIPTSSTFPISFQSRPFHSSSSLPQDFLFSRCAVFFFVFS